MCCKDTKVEETEITEDGPRKQKDDDAALLNGDKRRKKVQVRKTIEITDVEFDEEGRHGAEDPDLEKLQREAEERRAAEEAKKTQGVKRSKDRKGTGFVKKDALPIDDDDEEDEDEPNGRAVKMAPPEDDESTPKAVTALEKPAGHENRCKKRKGTGFVKKAQVPVDDEDDED